MIAGLLFGLGARRRWTRPDRLNNEFAAFCAGWLVLALALVSPIHELGSLLFWVHMTQHELLILAGAPLLTLARPLVPLLRGLPLEWRKTLGHFSRLPMQVPSSSHLAR